MLAVLTAIIGVLVGGAVRAWEAKAATKRRAEATLSALVAEIEALTRLINHRNFIPTMIAYRDAAQQKIEAGRAEETGTFLVISLKQNYFSTYEAVNADIGLLPPYWADRITRFYTYLKAATENYAADSPFASDDISNRMVVDVLNNDLFLLHSLVVLGTFIARNARNIEVPKGLRDPFAQGPGGAEQPALPAVDPSAQQAEAAAYLRPLREDAVDGR